MKHRVGLLFDSINNNTGDKAMGIVLRQLFSKYDDIELVDLNPLNIPKESLNTVIIGGGQLLRGSGDSYYDGFRLRGKYILNAIGTVPPLDDIDYLNEYTFVSARTSTEVDLLKQQVATAQLVPCMTTVLKGEKYRIPGVKKGEKLIGIHLVPDSLRVCPDIVRQINALPHRKVIIPFTHYNKDREFMMSLPFDWDSTILLDELSPEQLHSVLGQMHYNILSSLHATIFSYSQNVPFVTLNQQKTVDYLADRKLESYVFSSSDSLAKILSEFRTKLPDMKAQVKADKQRIKEVFDQYLDIIRSSTPVELPAQKASITRDDLERDILDSVIQGRDRLVTDLESHIQYFTDQIAQRQAEIAHVTNQLSTSDTRIHSLIASREYKLGWHIAHPRGSLGSISRKSKKYLYEKSYNNTPSRSLVDKRIQSHPQAVEKTSDLAVVAHIYYIDMWDDIVKNLCHLDKAKISYDLHITLPESNTEFRDTIVEIYPSAHIYIMKNRGRDILPFVTVARILIDNGYRYALKLHTKKSLHWDGGEEWFDNTMSNLLPSSRKTLRSIMQTLEDPQTGIIGSAEHYYPLQVNFEANGRHMNRLLKRTYNFRVARKVLQTDRDDYGFFAGSMFWVRLDAIENLVEKSITTRYEPEQGQIDGTVAHAVERLISIIPEVKGLHNYELKDSKLSPRQNHTDNYPSWYKNL